MNVFLFMLKKKSLFLNIYYAILIILRKNGTMNTKINGAISFARN